MDIDSKFDAVFLVGRVVCSAYTGFSKTEILHCLQKCNWLPLQQFLMANDPYVALINFSLHPLADVVGYFLMFVGCMVLFPDEKQNIRLCNLLEIVDTLQELDAALTNARMMRALLALNAKYCLSSPSRCFWLFYNAKRVLAHILKKYPSYFSLNILRTNRKSKALRFKPEDVDLFW